MRSSGGISPSVNAVTNSRTRSSSSLAASSVKVTAAMCLGRMPVGEHQGDAAGHDRGLTRAGARLDEEGAIVSGHRA